MESALLGHSELCNTCKAGAASVPYLRRSTNDCFPRFGPAPKIFRKEFVHATVEIEVVLGTCESLAFIRINDIDLPLNF